MTGDLDSPDERLWPPPTPVVKDGHGIVFRFWSIDVLHETGSGPLTSEPSPPDAHSVPNPDVVPDFALM